MRATRTSLIRSLAQDSQEIVLLREDSYKEELDTTAEHDGEGTRDTEHEWSPAEGREAGRWGEYDPLPMILSRPNARRK